MTSVRRRCAALRQVRPPERTHDAAAFGRALLQTATGAMLSPVRTGPHPCPRSSSPAPRAPRRAMPMLVPWVAMVLVLSGLVACSRDDPVADAPASSSPARSDGTD